MFLSYTFTVDDKHQLNLGWSAYKKMIILNFTCEFFFCMYDKNLYLFLKKEKKTVKYFSLKLLKMLNIILQLFEDVHLFFFFK